MTTRLMTLMAAAALALGACKNPAPAGQAVNKEVLAGTQDRTWIQTGLTLNGKEEKTVPETMLIRADGTLLKTIEMGNMTPTKESKWSTTDSAGKHLLIMDSDLQSDNTHERLIYEIQEQTDTTLVLRTAFPKKDEGMYVHTYVLRRD